MTTSKTLTDLITEAEKEMELDKSMLKQHKKTPVWEATGIPLWIEKEQALAILSRLKAEAQKLEQAKMKEFERRIYKVSDMSCSLRGEEAIRIANEIWGMGDDTT